MDDKKIVSPTSVARPAPFRGALLSSDYNDNQSELVTDVANLAKAVNSLNSRLTRSIITLQNENSYLRRKIDAIDENRTYNEKVAARYGLLSSRAIDFSETKGISFPNGLEDSRSAMLAAEFGELTVPAITIENKFYVTSLSTDKIVLPVNLSVVVNGTFDKGDGVGAVNYERGGKVYPGKAEYAFNGYNDLYWIRKVEFPIDSKVDQVECELTVTVPEGSSSKANLIELLPFPNGSVDVTELAYASDLGNNFTRIPTFTPANNLTAKRYHFAATTIDKVKIRLRQRNWVEENGKKVFYYGLQELGLKLVSYDKTYTQGAAFGSNNSFIVKIDAPSGFTFDNLHGIDFAPNFMREDANNRHVHVRISNRPDIAAGALWDSDTKVAPQLADPISVKSASMWAFVELNFVTTSGGVLSPFPVGTTPYINGIGLTFSLLES